jgi:hypothetical protein
MSPEWWIEAQMACEAFYGDEWNTKSDEEQDELIRDWAVGNY